MLLDDKIAMSNSLTAVLDGESPKSSHNDTVDTSEVIPSVLEPVNVDSPVLSDITEEEETGDKPGVRVTSLDIPLPSTVKDGSQISVAQIDVNGQEEFEDKENHGQNRRKRRSLSEMSENNPIAKNKEEQRRKILFETDV